MVYLHETTVFDRNLFPHLPTWGGFGRKSPIHLHETQISATNIILPRRNLGLDEELFGALLLHINKTLQIASTKRRFSANVVV